MKSSHIAFSGRSRWPLSTDVITFSSSSLILSSSKCGYGLHTIVVAQIICNWTNFSPHKFFITMWFVKKIMVRIACIGVEMVFLRIYLWIDVVIVALGNIIWIDVVIISLRKNFWHARIVHPVSIIISRIFSIEMDIFGSQLTDFMKWNILCIKTIFLSLIILFLSFRKNWKDIRND